MRLSSSIRLHVHPTFGIFSHWLILSSEAFVRTIRILSLSLILSLSVILPAPSTFAQRVRPLPADTLAEVGGTAILARDLLERLELMPWPGKERGNASDSVKIRALQSLVAERLLSHEALLRDLGSDSASVLRTERLERMLVRDELYRREVSPRAVPTKAELREGLRRYASSLTVIIFTARSEEGARSIYTAARRHSLDSTLERIPLILLARTDTLSFAFGDVEKPLEDAAYGIPKIGGVAPPVLLRRLGWVVVGLLRKLPYDKYLTQSNPDRIRAVENIIRQSKEREIAARFSGGILSAKRGEADSILFDRFADVALRVFRNDSLRLRKQGVFSLTLIADTLEHELRTVLAAPMVAMEGGDLTVLEILEGFRSRPTGFPTLDGEDFRNRLNAAIRDLVAAEYLSREGLRRGLQNSPQVRHDVATWADYWRSRAMERAIRDSIEVADEDVSAFLIEHGAILGVPYEVNLREILTDSLSASLRMLERILDGEEMGALARANSKRRGWAERGGESLWFRVSGYPDLGFRAMEADSGALVGPVRVRNGYSLFRVLGKRRVAGDSLISYDSLKALTRAKVRAEKGERAVNGRIAGFARAHGATIHYDRLRRVEVTRQNMVTRRMIGFGGVMIAVPTILPKFDWVKEARDVEGVLP